MTHAFPYLLLPHVLSSRNRARRRERGDLTRGIMFGAVGIVVFAALFQGSFWLTSRLDSYDELAVPEGAEVVGVFVNGVPLIAGQDYDVLADRIHLTKPLEQRTSVSTIGKLMLSLGVGVYNKGDVVDLQLRRGGQTQVVRGRRFGEK